MDVFVAAVVLGVAAGLTVRGRSTYGPPRAIPIVIAAALVQLVGGRFEGRLRTAVIALSLLLALAWLLWQRRHAASVLLSVGALANAAVIAVNGGMPVDPYALAKVGRAGVDVADGFLYKHVALDAGTRLAFLADRIPIPVQRNVISIGDVVMAIAIALWMADGVAGWRMSRRSTRAVHGQHGRGADPGFVARRVGS
jgi:hypothetical protein